MQTFMPCPPAHNRNVFGSIDFTSTFEVLDRQRLGKQRVEAMQLVSAILNKSGWKNHPAAKMWERNVPMLIAYGIQCCEVWIDRGYKDTVRHKLLTICSDQRYKDSDFTVPWWLGNEDFHRSHRSNLLRKMPQHYRNYWPEERDDLPYVWPF